MIPLLDLRAQYAGIKVELDAAVLETLASGAYVSGPKVDAFEKSFAAYTGAKEAVALNSGTSALHLALLALGIGPGDEVIAPAMTFVATVAAIRYAGATPVLVDADPLTWNIDPAGIARAITPRTKAIIPVHLHGRMADMAAIMAIAAQHGLPVIEDAAQAHGATWKGRGAGTIGAIGCFSFYPGKNLGACGEGGGAVTNDPALAARMRKLRDWGQEGRYNHVEHAFNYRMDGIQGAILSVKLAHLPRWTEAPARGRSPLRYAARRASRAVASEAQGVGTRLPRLCAAPSGPRPARARPRRSRRRDGPPLSAPGASAASLCRSRQWPRQLPGGRGPRRRIPLLAHLPRAHPRAAAPHRRRAARPPCPCLGDQSCRVKPAKPSTRRACLPAPPASSPAAPASSARISSSCCWTPVRRRCVSSTTWCVGGATTSPARSPATECA